MPTCPGCSSANQQSVVRNLNLVDWIVCGTCGMSYGVYEEGRPEGKLPNTINKFSLGIECPAKSFAAYELAMKVSAVVNFEGAFAEGRAPLEDEDACFQLDSAGTWWLKCYPDHGWMLVSRWGMASGLIPTLKGLSHWAKDDYVDKAGGNVREVHVPVDFDVAGEKQSGEDRHERRSRLAATILGRQGMRIKQRMAAKAGELARHRIGGFEIRHEHGKCVVEAASGLSAELAGHVRNGIVWALRGKPQVNMGFGHVWEHER